MGERKMKPQLPDGWTLDGHWLKFNGHMHYVKTRSGRISCEKIIAHLHEHGFMEHKKAWIAYLKWITPQRLEFKK